MKNAGIHLIPNSSTHLARFWKNFFWPSVPVCRFLFHEYAHGFTKGLEYIRVAELIIIERAWKALRQGKYALRRDVKHVFLSGRCLYPFSVEDAFAGKSCSTPRYTRIWFPNPRHGLPKIHIEEVFEFSAPIVSMKFQGVKNLVAINHQFHRLQKQAFAACLWADKQREVPKINCTLANLSKVTDRKRGCCFVFCH